MHVYVYFVCVRGIIGCKGVGMCMCGVDGGDGVRQILDSKASPFRIDIRPCMLNKFSKEITQYVS